MEAAARKTIPTENHNPKSKPNNNPATIKPNAKNPPMIIMFFKNEKSVLVKNTTPDKPVKSANVKTAAYLIRCVPSVKLIAM